MELNDEQKAEVAAWFAAGASLDEIQKRVKADFGIHMTYLDVRLLVAELPQPAEKAEEEGAGMAEMAKTPKTPRTDPTGNDQDFADGPDSRQGEDGEEEAPLPEDGENADGTEEQAVSTPTVTIDAIMIPGTIASGDVTFSDGQKGKWFLDQMGRLGLGGDLPQGYRPSPTDAALFQQQLMGLLQSKGLC